MYRSIKRTVLVTGEGYREYSFLEYLRTLYLASEKYIRIQDAHGGSPAHQIAVMRNELRLREYDEKYALFDTDGNLKKVTMAQQHARQLGIKVLLSTPSIDYPLVELITTNHKLLQRASSSTAQAKEELKRLCDLEKLNDEIDWPVYFPKTLLGEARKNNIWLDDIIKIFE